LTTTANGDGEKIELRMDSVILHVKNFSTYAIGYTETTAGTYTVTVQNDGHGTASASPTSAEQGTEIALTATADSGYRFKEWQMVSGSVTISNNKFTMPAANVTVKAVFEYVGGGSTGSHGGSGSSTYPPTIQQPEHGTITVSPSRPKKDDRVIVTVTPEAGCEVDTVTVTDKNGKPVEVTRNEDGTFTFTQPAGQVTITAAMKAVSASCPRDKTCPIAAFDDASAEAWYHDGVHYCLENGLMTGYGNGRFGPNDTLTRAMLAQILYDQAGKPAVSGASPFDDVAKGKWYAKAVLWAEQNGIVGGYGNGSFGPEDPITREQLAAMLYRYEQSQGGGFKGQWMFLLDFNDREEVSEWAYGPMCWMTMHGIVNGKGNKILDPKGSATRAEVAAMLMRYMLAAEK